MRRFRRDRFHQSAEMNITAFMNLMVILVPFLLITTVFSRLVILELNLPAPSSSSANKTSLNPPLSLQLEITIRQDRLEIADNGKPPLVMKNKQKQYDLSKLQNLLKSIKAQFPDKTSVSLLLEENIPYESLVQVMDSVRMVRVNAGKQIIQAELFPDISIGDAPPRRLPQTPPQ